jgi:hypothetical protein
LHRPLGGIAVHVDQLRHLLKMSQHPGITIQVVPLAAGCAPGLTGGFTLAELPGRVESLLVESTVGGQVTSDPVLVAEHRRRYDTIRADAYSKRESAQLIKDAIEKWTSQG